MTKPLHDCVIVLDRPKSPENVGTILRSALALCGPEVSVLVCNPRWDVKRYPLDRLKTDTNKAARYLDARVLGDTTTAVRDFLDREANTQNYRTPVVIERGVAQFASDYLDAFAHPKRTAYIFGPEDGSVSDHLRRSVHNVEIRGAANLPDPHQGCLNLATAVSVVLYDRAAKLGF